MDALVNVFVGEVLILQCHENGDCHAVALRASSELSQSADYQSVRSRVWSELLQSAGGCQSERSRVFPSELHRYSCEPSDDSQVGRRTRKICRRSHKHSSIHKQEETVPKLILKDSRQRHDGSSCELSNPSEALTMGIAAAKASFGNGL